MMSLVSNLIGPVTGLLDKVIEDKDQKAQLAHEIATMSDNHAQQALMGQLEINKAEAFFERIVIPLSLSISFESRTLSLTT